MAAALFVLAAAAIGEPAHAAAEGVSVQFADAKTAQYKAIQATLAASAEFTSVTDAVNEVLVLPAPLTIEFKECGGEQLAAQLKQGDFVRVCYEDIAGDTVPEPGMTVQERAQDVTDAGLFYFLRGMGRGLITQLKLATDKQTDGADEFAAVISPLAGDALDAEDMAGMAEFAANAAALNTERKRKTFDGQPPMNDARAEHVNCLIYGSDPQQFQELVGHGDLSSDVAPGCEAKFNQRLQAWSQMLESHLKQ